MKPQRPVFTARGVLTARALRVAVVALALQAPASVQSQTSPGPQSVIQFNPLGFLQVGPNAELQRLVAPGFAMGAGIRIISFGLLSHVMIDDLNSAWTGSMNAVLYPKKRLEGWFFGPRIEIGRSDRENYTSNLLGGAMEFGHRWVRESGFTFSLGGQAGGLRANYTHKTDAFDTGRETYMFIMGVVGIGKAF